MTNEWDINWWMVEVMIVEWRFNWWIGEKAIDAGWMMNEWAEIGWSNEQWIKKWRNNEWKGGEWWMKGARMMNERVKEQWISEEREWWIHSWRCNEWMINVWWIARWNDLQIRWWMNECIKVTMTGWMSNERL